VEYTKSHRKGVSQVISSLMIVFLMLAALTTYVVFLSKNYSLASKIVERNQKETLRNMENIVIKAHSLNNETMYVLAYEGLRPNIEYVLVKCGNRVSLNRPEKYGLEFGKPIPEVLMEEIERGCDVILITERGKVYNIGLQASQIMFINEKLSKLDNITNINEVFNSVSQITPFLEDSSVTIASGKIYMFGSKGNVLYTLDMVNNIPIYDIVSQKIYTAPKGEYLGVFLGSLNSLGNEKVVLIHATPVSLTVLKIPVRGNTPKGKIKLGKGIYLVYLTGEAYDGFYSRRVYGEGVRAYISIYQGSSMIAYKMLDGADRFEYYFRGLRLREWSGQFDGVFALAVLEGEVTLEYAFSSEPTTWYMHHTFVVEKIANIGGNGELKIVKHNGKLYLEYKNYLFNLIATSGVVEGKLYDLGSYIIAPVGYIVNNIVSEGAPIPVSPGEARIVYFKPLTLNLKVDPMVLGVEKRHVYVRIESSYKIFRQAWGNLFDQMEGLNLKIYYYRHDALGNIKTYTTFPAIIPKNYYATLNIISDTSTTHSASLKVTFNGREAFSIPLPTTPKSYLIKLGGNTIEYGQLTITLTTSHIRPNNNIKVAINF